MPTRLIELVDRFGGQLTGNPELEVSAIATLQRAGPTDLAFLANARLRPHAAYSRAGALVLAPHDDAAIASTCAGTRIVSANPHAWFARAAQVLVARTAGNPAPGIHPSASVHPRAHVDPGARIGPHATVDAGAIVMAGAVIDAGCHVGRDAVVGAATHLFAHATLHARCIIGARGIVHSGAVIGGDGFGFALDDGVYIKIPQVGRVVLGDDVDVGANTTIDRGALDDTVIGDGVKLDNQIQIGHNCRIGAHTAMAGCVGVAGSAVIGSHCTFGGAAMINGHIEIVDHVQVTAGTLVANSILEPGRYTGFYPMARNAEWERNAVLLRNLTALRERIRTLERTLKGAGGAPPPNGGSARPHGGAA